METLEQKMIKSPLKNEKVKLVPITDRKGGWLPEGHDGKFMYTGTKRYLCVPKVQGGLLDPLTEDERNYFESPESGMGLKKGDLSIYKKSNSKTGEKNYWEDFYVIIDKNGLELDLSKPIDYIKLKVAVLNADVAPSYKERKDKGSYKFYVMKNDEEAEIKSVKADVLKTAWKEYGKIEDSTERMRNFLLVYYIEKNDVNKKVAKNTKAEQLKAWISDIIENDVNTFVKVITDENFSIKAFINECMENGLIQREGKTAYYVPTIESRFAHLKELVVYLSDVKNQEVKTLLTAQLKNTK